VFLYLMQGMTEKQISEKLGVSRSTIVRDVKFWRKQNSSWFDGFTKDDGYQFEYRLALERLVNGIYELNNLKEAATTKEKIQIINSIVQIQKLYWELLNRAPMVNSFRKFVQEKILYASPKKESKKPKFAEDGTPIYYLDSLP